MKRSPLRRKTQLRPKKQMRRRGRAKPTKAQQDYHDRARALGCLICGQPAEIHHMRKGILGMGQKVDHDRILPICYNHHESEEEGAISLHGTPALFEQTYWSEIDLERKLKERLNNEND